MTPMENYEACRMFDVERGFPFNSGDNSNF